MSYESGISDFRFSEPNASWWLIEGNPRYVCSTSPYELALFVTNQANQILGRTTIKDWAEQRIRPLSGRVSFSSAMQKYLWALSPATLRRLIREEARSNQFGPYTTKAAIRLMMSTGQPTINGTAFASRDTGNTDYDPARDLILLPEQTILPSMNAPLDPVGSPSSTACVEVRAVNGPPAPIPAPPPPPAPGQPPAPIPAPPPPPRPDEIFDQVPTTPLEEPTPKDDPGNKGVFDPVPEDQLSPTTPSAGTYDQYGDYVPAPQEVPAIIYKDPIFVDTGARLPPPPPGMFPSSSSSTGTLLILGALGLAVAYAMSQSGSSAEPVPAAPRKNPRPRRSRRR